MTAGGVEAGTPLARLAERLGIETAYRDVEHRERHIGRETAVALAEAMGFEAGNDDAIHESLHVLAGERWSRLLEPATVVSEGSPLSVLLTLSEAAIGHWAWRVTSEDGRNTEGTFDPASLPVEEERETDGQKQFRRRLETGTHLSPGYHSLQILGPDHRAAQTVICAPEHCFRPDENRQDWGVAIQLYGLRSETNWGIGDFSDLARFAQNASELGLSMVGINPLHALHSGHGGNSPYFPSNRLFLNLLYIDIEAVPEFATCRKVQDLVRSPDLQERLRHLRSEPLVNYDAVAEIKLPILEDLYVAFRSDKGERLQAFRRYQEKSGQELLHHATFEALSEHFGRDRSWTDWPVKYRTPHSPQIADFADESRHRVEFHQFLQWEAERQLSRARESGGMGVGLYGDIALGTAAHGSEAWAAQDCLCFGVRVGAPPDAFNQLGQDWGFPPLNPHALRRQAYGPFISLLRAAMRHCGAIRLDHVMGLARLFWIPPGETPAAGAYVRYPLDDLLAVVRLESVRNRCIVVGEDLGTVPENFREQMAASDVLSYRVLYFERTDWGGFRDPGQFPAQALATISTHDLPTLAGYWSGYDLDVKARLRLFSSPEAEQAARDERTEDLNRLAEHLNRHGGLASPNANGPEDLARAAVETLAKTPCRLICLQVEDLLGIEDQANMPGTIDEHPNWRRKLPVDVDAVLAGPVFEKLREICGNRGSG